MLTEKGMTMRKNWPVMIAGVAALVISASVSAQQVQASSKDGQIRTVNAASFEVWNAVTREWVDPESFWEHYAARPGAKYWGRTRVYPPYRQVGELDTIIIELDSGACLMEFWHSRWRRANDVRRWHSRFNEYGGCPHVFD